MQGAAAQEKGDNGITMGYPLSVGFVTHVSNRVALRPELQLTFASTDTLRDIPDLYHQIARYASDTPMTWVDFCKPLVVLAILGFPILVRAVIFRMERVPFVDKSGIHALRETLLTMGKKDIVFILTGLQPEVRRQLEDWQIIPQVIPVDRVFASFAHAADWLEGYLKTNPRKKIRKIDFRNDLQINRINERRN